MLSKNKIKFIHSLKIKKYRDMHGLFIVEGLKIFEELTLAGMKPIYIAASSVFFSAHRLSESVEKEEITKSELLKISSLQTPSDVFALFEIPEVLINYKEIFDKLSLFLDDVQNPGNIGTIIRTAEWFGIRNIFCSRETADIYNPKVVQATMGGIARVKIVYVETEDFFKNIKNLKIPVYGTFLDGENIYAAEFQNSGIIVLGNEGNGITSKTEKYISQRLYIPSFPKNVESVESLNVAVAGAIIFSEFRRRTGKYI
jgi:RNA methyltransferase, TrmH family